jgi:hypothetical protein
MFGITTKADPKATFTNAIDAAVTAADRGVSTHDIVSYLRSRAQALEDRAYQAPHIAAIPKMYDGYGKPIDTAAKIQAVERERQRRIDAASEIPRDQRQSAASGYRVP